MRSVAALLLAVVVAVLLLPAQVSGNNCRDAPKYANLTVTTRTGTFLGDLNDTYPDVRQFKYVPYAKRLDDCTDEIDSTTFGAACPQYVPAKGSVYTFNLTGLRVNSYGQNKFAGEMLQTSQEDCLSLGIWTPAGATPQSRLPVIIFITGGGDNTGGVDVDAQKPAGWVHRTQKHIVVTMNHRLNIFGFPNARGLKNGTETNFAFQDQRAAVEWVHENIAAFGGDPDAMTLWGQSAGGGAGDNYLFAHPDDPLIRASVSDSGQAESLATNYGPDGTPYDFIDFANNADFSGSNFTFVAKSLGCDFCDAQRELDCMRHVPAARIMNFVGQYGDNGTKPALSFFRRPDSRWVFPAQEYHQRARDGRIAQVPKIIGTNAREGASLVPTSPANYSLGPSEAWLTLHTVNIICISYNESGARVEGGLPTYRYQFAGNFTSVSGGVPWLGAFHSSDLYNWFGSYPLTAPYGGGITELQKETAGVMQDYLYNFVADPYSLPSKGWPLYDPSDAHGGTFVRFGTGGKAVQTVDGNDIEGICHGLSTAYDTTP